MKLSLYGTAFLLATAQTVSAVDYQTAMQSFVESEVRQWAQDPLLIQAVTAQNALTGGFDASRISQLDEQWAAELGIAAKPLVSSVVDSAAAEFLRAKLADSGGAIFEAFVMDAQGLNVAASGITSDYWQGDEAKFRNNYKVGSDAIDYSEVEFDESSQQYQAQISFSLTDPSSGVVIGAITLGVNPDSFM